MLDVEAGLSESFHDPRHALGVVELEHLDGRRIALVGEVAGGALDVERTAVKIREFNGDQAAAAESSKAGRSGAVTRIR